MRTPPGVVPELDEERAVRREVQGYFIRLYEPAERIRQMLNEYGGQVTGVEEALMLTERLLKAQLRETKRFRDEVERAD